jgi:phage terminase large subunit-like protein
LKILNLTIHAHLPQIILLKKHTQIQKPSNIYDSYTSTLFQIRIHITRESKILGNVWQHKYNNNNNNKYAKGHSNPFLKTRNIILEQRHNKQNIEVFKLEAEHGVIRDKQSSLKVRPKKKGKRKIIALKERQNRNEREN